MSPRALGQGAPSATWAIEVAFVDAIKAAASFDALIGDRVFNLAAPEGAEMPYLVVGTPSETDFRTFHRRGRRNEIELHVWTPDRLTQETALTIYNALAVHFDGCVLPLVGHRGIVCRLRLITILADPDADASHLVAMLTVDSQPNGDG